MLSVFCCADLRGDARAGAARMYTFYERERQCQALTLRRLAPDQRQATPHLVYLSLCTHGLLMGLQRCAGVSVAVSLSCPVRCCCLSPLAVVVSVYHSVMLMYPLCIHVYTTCPAPAADAIRKSRGRLLPLSVWGVLGWCQLRRTGAARCYVHARRFLGGGVLLHEFRKGQGYAVPEKVNVSSHIYLYIHLRATHFLQMTWGYR